MEKDIESVRGNKVQLENHSLEISPQGVTDKNTKEKTNVSHTTYTHVKIRTRNNFPSQ
jgi:hypothetical protein